MRYDTMIYFRKTVQQGAYNPETGDYADSTGEEVGRLAAVSAASIETMRAVFGEVREGALTVHLLNHYTGAFDRIRIGSDLYRAAYRYPLRRIDVYVLEKCGEVSS